MDDSGDTQDATITGGAASDDSDQTREATTGGTHPIGNAQTLPARRGARVERRLIGRYRIMKRLGAGGMGEVWQATDPELGREVAIKLLHGGDVHPQLAERLRREAQALAKLDHPNVVTVHDVGVDEAGELYIVMQLVVGTTLDRAILTRRPREIIDLLAQAGRGLAAAHAAGIVHRDFKPTNVLVDTSGHVRVSDFGLARASDARDEAGDSAAGDLATSMTRGELVGTPAYMAPEQLQGGPVTHATDQFAFCVTLWEALAGARPFAGRDLAALRDAVAKGPPKEAPPTIPRRLRGLLTRGLQRAPEARYPSMDALLADLEPSNKWLWVAGGVGVAALATTTVLLGITRPEGSDPCRGVEQPIDAVWGDPQRTAVRAALGSLAPSVIAVLDDRTARWRASRLDACQSSYVAYEPQSLDERDQRYACLDRALLDQRAAIELIARGGDGRLRANATQLASAGRDPAECTRRYATTRVTTGTPARIDPALAIEMATMAALREADQFEQFLARRDEIERRVLASGDQEAIADWFFSVSYMLRQVGDGALIREPMRRAAEAALAARRDDYAAHAWAELAVMTARASEIEGAENLLVMARGAAARADRPITGVWLALAEGQVALEKGAPELAIEKCRHALELARGLGLESSYLLDTSGCMFDAQLARGDLQGALAAAKTRLDRMVALYGADSPAEHEGHRSLAIAYAALGDEKNQLAEWRLALAGIEKHYGPDSAQLVWTLKDFAIAQTPGGAMSTPEALAAIKRAVAIAEKTFAPTDPQRAPLYEALAYVHGGHQNLEASIAAYDKAIAMYEKLDDPLALARTLYNSADAYKQSERCDRALPRFERAAKVAAATGSAALMEGNALYGRGACLGAAKQWVEADAALRTSIELIDKVDGQHLFGAQSRWELAEQLVKRGKKAEGLAIAQGAVALLAGKPPPAEEFAKQIAEWIEKQ